MPRGVYLTEHEKRKIVELRFVHKLSFRKIRDRVGRSVCAIQKVVADYSTSGKIDALQRHKNSKLSPSDERYILLMSKRFRRKTVPELTSDFNTERQNTVSFSTIRRSLHRFSMFGRVACKKPLLRKYNLRKRLRFAKQHVHWTVKQWARVLFTDESKFEVFGNHRRIVVRRRPGERYESRCLVPTVKHGGGSIMVWGGISAAGALPLKLITGIMVKENYKQILEKRALPGKIIFKINLLLRFFLF